MPAQLADDVAQEESRGRGPRSGASVEVGQLIVNPSAEKTGRRFDPLSTTQEASYAMGLLAAWKRELAAQGIGDAQLEALAALKRAMTPAEAAAAAAVEQQKRVTQDLKVAQAAAADEVATTRNLCREPLERVSPGAMGGFPRIGQARRLTGPCLDVLQRTLGFVGAWETSLAQGGVDSEPIKARLEARIREVGDANDIQEQAKIDAQDATSQAARIRGQIYLTCGQVYRGGRTAFRSSPELKARFKYKHMTRSSAPKPAAEAEAVAVAQEPAPADEVAESMPAS